MKQIIFLLGLLISSPLIFADSNGVWIFPEDIKGGTFGVDEDAGNYTFDTKVYFLDEVNFTLPVDFEKTVEMTTTEEITYDIDVSEEIALVTENIYVDERLYFGGDSVVNNYNEYVSFDLDETSNTFSQTYNNETYYVYDYEGNKHVFESDLLAGYIKLKPSDGGIEISSGDDMISKIQFKSSSTNVGEISFDGASNSFNVEQDFHSSNFCLGGDCHDSWASVCESWLVENAIN